MIHVRRAPSRKIKLVIVSKSKTSIDALLSVIDIKLKPIISTHDEFYKAECYGERRKHQRQVIKPSFVTRDMWVYEYHDKEGYVYHNKQYGKIPSLDIVTLMDVLHKTGPLSVYEALKVLLRKRIFRLDDGKISPLLEIEDSELFDSILIKIINIYTREDFYKYLETDMVDRLERESDRILRKIRTHHKLYKQLQHFTYQEFLAFNN